MIACTPNLLNGQCVALHDDFNRATAQVAVAQMRMLGVVFVKLGVGAGRQRFQAGM